MLAETGIIPYNNQSTRRVQTPFVGLNLFFSL